MAQMIITAEYTLGDTIYIKTDIDQRPYIVTGISIRPGHLTYQVTNSEVKCDFYDFEISAEKNVVRAL